MKQYISFFITIAAAYMLAGCNKGLSTPDSRTITVKASIGAMTKVAYTVDASTFTAGDTLALYAWTGDKTVIPANLVVNNVVNTLDGVSGLWKPATQMLWYDMTTPHYFMAVAPARTVTNFTADPYVLDPAADKFQQSDLLIATNLNGLVATNNPVSLTFDHAMAKLNVNLRFRNQWTPQEDLPDSINVEAKVDSVFAVSKNNATIDYVNKTVTAVGGLVGLPLNKTSNVTWTTLMVPQAGFRTIYIDLKGNDEWLGGNGRYLFKHSEDIPLVSGKFTTVNLIVGRDQITLDERAGGITITEWATGTVINNGEAQIPE
jgi:hypothetical protein